MLYALAFGIWCFITAVLQNPLAEFTAFVVTFANLIGVMRAVLSDFALGERAIVCRRPSVDCRFVVVQGGEYILLAGHAGALHDWTADDRGTAA